MMIFNDVAPETIVNLHSLEYPTTYTVVWRMLGFAVMSIPFFIFGMYVCTKMGSSLIPTTRDCPDQAHMFPALIRYIKRQDFNNAEDFLGRNNGNFYKSLMAEDFNANTRMFDLLRKNGLKF